MRVADYESTIQRLVLRGRPFREIEEAITKTPLDRAQQAALWLLAWSYPDTPSHSAAG